MSSASVTVADEIIAEIDVGILLLLGIQKHDDEKTLQKLLDKVVAYRIFADEKGHMNNSLADIAGALLVVSQFTIAANTKKGLRPSFSAAASPQLAEHLYDEFLLRAYKLVPDGVVSKVAAGSFGADMKVGLLNDGPVTFLLET